MAWRLKTKFGDVAIQFDEDFPYSRVGLYWLEFDLLPPRPHVEREGKLCLRSPVLPLEPLRSVQAAIREGIELLRKNAKGELDADFNQDFQAYWNYNADAVLAASMLPPIAQSTFAVAAVTERRRYIFANKEDARRWWRNRSSQFVRNLPRVALIKLTALPLPNQFPKNAKELLWLVENYSVDGRQVLAELLKPIPKSAIVAFVGLDNDGGQRVFACLLSRPVGKDKAYVHWKQMTRGYRRHHVPIDILCDRYELKRFRMEVLDVALSRVPHDVKGNLENKKVAIIGCGAIGSGVARFLALSGVGSLLLIDPENLDWENIRRHELGALDVGFSKSQVLAARLRAQVPDITSIEHSTKSIQQIIRTDPNAFDQFDLIVSATGDFIADSAIAHLQSSKSFNGPIVFSWMEAYALAAHAVVTVPGLAPFEAGFDDNGTFKLQASQNTKPAPQECGGNTTPFGVIETAQAQAITSQLALEVLRGIVPGGTWRTWLASAAILADSGGNWSPEWVEKRGKPPLLGGLQETTWKF